MVMIIFNEAAEGRGCGSREVEKIETYLQGRLLQVVIVSCF